MDIWYNKATINEKETVEMKLLNKWLSPLIVITFGIIGIVTPFAIIPAPSIISILGGTAIGLLTGAIVVTGSELFFGDNDNLEEDKKKLDLKKNRTRYKKGSKQNAYSLGKKKEMRKAGANPRPVKNILTLEEEKNKTNSTSTKKRPVRNVLKLDDEKETVDQATSSNQKHPVKNILTLEEESKTTSTSTRNHHVRNILKLDDEEENKQENTYSLHPVTDKKNVLFQEPYNKTTSTGTKKDNLWVNDEKIMYDVKSSLEHLRKTLAETEKQINELRALLENLTEIKGKGQSKVKIKIN